MEERFGASQDRRGERFEEVENERRTEFSIALNDWRETWESELASRTVEADQFREELRKLASEAERVLGTSAAAATYGAAEREAERQGRAADWWRGWAILALGGAALSGLLFLALAVADPPSNSNALEILVYLSTRVSITGFVASIGFYCARESSRHRLREVDARGSAMNMAAFRPFLAELPPEERNLEIRLAARRFFGNYDVSDIPDPEPFVDPGTAVLEDGD